MPPAPARRPASSGCCWSPPDPRARSRATAAPSTPPSSRYHRGGEHAVAVAAGVLDVEDAEHLLSRRQAIEAEADVERQPIRAGGRHERGGRPGHELAVAGVGVDGDEQGHEGAGLARRELAEDAV